VARPLLPTAALAAGALLLLAGCSVDVEGAACATPFAPGQCPEGQACGNDRVCSERAAACAAPEAHCCPEGTEGCAASGLRCGDGSIQRCAGPADDGDGVCGTWIASVTCTPGLVCGAGVGGALACLCPEPEGASIVADAVEGSPADAARPPTGAHVGAGWAAPASCRFRSLADALDAAAARGSGGTVDAVGAFRTSLEPRALAVPAGVTLRPLVPGEPVAIEVDGAVGAALELRAGASVQDVVVRSVHPDASGDGLAAACADATPISLARVRVEHALDAGRLAAGLRVAAPCAVSASGLEVAGAAVGIDAAGGRLTLESTRIEESAAEGIRAYGTELVVADSLLRGNQDGGLVTQSLQLLDVRNTLVCGNLSASLRGEPFVARTAGGVVLRGNPPMSPVVFRGNRIYGNSGDQVLVVGAAASNPWVLDGAADAASCAADANVFAEYPADPAARGLFAASATVQARYDAWAGVTPTPPPIGRDFEPASSVDAGVSGGGPARFCPPPDSLPACD
jgi:hypothetical protein